MVSIVLNYSNLSDIEFEELAKDILERKLNRKLQSFGPGKDGGIDLRNISNKNELIVQVKHFRKSGYRMLYSSLNKELENVETAL